MAQIIETIVGDRKLLLGNEQFGRTMALGIAWNRLRIGIRAAVQASGAVNASGLAMGVCQGTTDMYKSVTCTDFVGGHYGNTVNNTNYQYTAGPPNYIFSNAVLAIRRIGNVNTTNTTTSSSMYMSASPTTTRSMWIVEIQRGSPNYSITQFIPTSVANVQIDISFATFMVAMESEPPPTLQSQLATTVAYSGAGLMDTVNIAWNNSIQPIEISDICVARLA